MASLDRVLFRAINGWPDSFGGFLIPFSTGHELPWFRGAMLAILVAMIWRGGAFRRAAPLSLIAFPAADWLCNLAKYAFPSRRPYQELFDVASRVGLSESAGTASSHAANLAAVATVMTLGLGWRWGAPWIVVALLVGLSRVYVGAHYPWQVLLGWTIGVSLGIVADQATRAIADWIVRLRTADDSARVLKEVAVPENVPER